MKIETKYNIGTRVYFMRDNKIDNSFVDNIKVEVWESKLCEKYWLNSRTDWYDVSQLFPSKEELIKSL